MTEAQWLACDDPIDMLLVPPGKSAGDRKVRLFSCACCRRVWDLLSDDNRSAVELAERYADGQASGEELTRREEDSRLYGDVDEEEVIPEDQPPAYWANVAGWHLLMARAMDGYYEVCDATRRLARDRSGEWEDVVQARLLRDVLGNPFRPATFAAAWRAPAVIALARTIYGEGAFDEMPILADALEEAGCDNTDILRHCREPGLHVKGCWIVDLVLGKE